MSIFSRESIMESEFLREMFNQEYAEKFEVLKTKSIDEGRQEGKLEMARGLYDLGIPMEQIVKAAKLPKRTVTKFLSAKP